MELSDLVDQIFEAILNPTSYHDDERVQQMMIRSDVENLLEDWASDVKREAELAAAE